MAWRRPGDKPLSEPMMVNLLLMHICVTQPQWVNQLAPGRSSIDILSISCEIALSGYHKTSLTISQHLLITYSVPCYQCNCVYSCWIHMVGLWMKFIRTVFPNAWLLVSQHCFKSCLGDVSQQFWNQCWSSSGSTTSYGITREQRVNQGSPFSTARRPGVSKTTSRASGFEQIFPLYIL